MDLIYHLCKNHPSNNWFSLLDIYKMKMLNKINGIYHDKHQIILLITCNDCMLTLCEERLKFSHYSLIMFPLHQSSEKISESHWCPKQYTTNATGSSMCWKGMDGNGNKVPFGLCSHCQFLELTTTIT